MAKVIFGNHSSVVVPRQDRESICKFYCDVLGGKIMGAGPERDFIRLEENFYIAFLYGDVPDVSEFSRTARSIWLEIKSDNVEEMTKKILDFGVRKLDVPDPHLYFQAPGGQCMRLVGVNEDLSFYEGVGEGPNVANIKQALKKMEGNNYSTSITVNAPAEEAMKKISQVNLWWAKNFFGCAERLHDKFTVTFGETFVDFEISELVPNKKVVWKVTDCNLHWINNKKEWNGTEVVFEIAENNGATQVNFTHVGLVPSVECYNDCEAGWGGHITGSLAKLINEGQGMPE